MAGKKKKTTTPKVKKKKWMPIYAPKQFNEVLLGETYVAEEEELNNKYVTANLSTVIRNIRKQNMNVQFKVIKVDEGKAYTTVVGYSLINAAIKRIVRRGRDKVADSFLAKTKDKQVVRIKPLIITTNKGTKALQSAIRLEARRIIREYAYAKQAEDLFADIVSANLQKKVKQSVAKIFPLKAVEIRIAKIEENSKVIVTDGGVKTEAVTIRSKEKGEDYDDGLKQQEAIDQEKLYGVTEDKAPEESEDFGDDSEDFGEEELESDVELKKEDKAESSEEAKEEATEEVAESEEKKAE